MNSQEQMFRSKLSDLRETGDSEELLELYIEGWQSGICSSPMQEEDFLSIFCDPSCSGKAVELRRTGRREVINFLRLSAECVDVSEATDDSDCLAVLVAYAPGRLQDTSILAIVRSYVGEQAVDFARRMLEYRMNREGREAARRLLLSLLGEDMTDDVQYSAVRFGAEHDLLMTPEILSLPPRPRYYWTKVAISGISPLTDSMATEMQLLGIPAEARAKVAALLRPTTLGLQIQRKDFTGNELENLLFMNGWNPTFDASRWARLIERRLGLPMDELVRGVYALSTQKMVGDGLPTCYSVSVLRLLHMKALLGTPVLRPPSIVPENSLFLEIISHFLGNTPINYDGNLMFNGAAEDLRKDSRRKMAEVLGEVFAVLFLEDSVGLDLSSLSRIPEASESTPDFRAYSRDNRRIVIEAKGASSWRYFQDSIRKARQQLGKEQGHPRVLDRVFVCRTYVAGQNSKRGSQFAADDPPLNLDHFFGEFLDDHALQHHFAGVAQLAGLMATARRVLEPQKETSDHEEEAKHLTIGDRMYVGTAQRISTLALSLGYALPEGFDRLFLFQGIEGTLRDSLWRRQWYRRGGRSQAIGKPQRETNGESNNTPLPPSGVGIVPDIEGRDNRGQGVYSLCTDGSVAAVVTEKVLQ